MSEEICKCCGQTLPAEYSFYLPPGHNLIFIAVLKAGKYGIRADRLFQKLYAGRQDGGPGYKTMSARIWYLNNRYLYKQGLKIQGEYNGGWEPGKYRLISHVVRRSA